MEAVFICFLATALAFVMADCPDQEEVSELKLCARAYADFDCKGRHVDFVPAQAMRSMEEKGLNDAISSVAVGAGCRLQVWEDSQFQGQSNLFYPGAVNKLTGFWSSGWNDCISSLRCVCNGYQGHSRGSKAMVAKLPGPLLPVGNDGGEGA